MVDKSKASSNENNKQLSKDEKKKLRGEYRQQERAVLLREMQISQSELGELLAYLETELSQEPYGCDHTLKHTQQFFINYTNKERILQWLAKYGGLCDCGIIYNVASEYYFILEEYFQPMPEIKAEIVELESFHTVFGLSMEAIPKPWRLLKTRHNDQDIFHFCYGKKGLNSELIVNCIGSNLVIEPDETTYFTHQWQIFTSLQASNFTVEKDFYTIEGKTIDAITVSCQGKVPVYAWLFDPNNMNWYLVVETTIARKVGDLKMVQALFGHMHLRQ